MSEPRTAIRARRSALAGRPPVVHRWPEFLVSAPHRVATAPGMPYGVRHARRVGSLVTACGRSAVGWPYFWTLRFERSAPSSCRDCEAALWPSAPGA